MADNIKKMVYPEADQMVQVLKDAVQELQNIVADLEGIAGTLESGAMLGDAGEAFAEGIRNKLINAINKLIDGYEDGARYVAMERDDMMTAEKKSAALFN
jgi:uncharacterized protein YukE